MLLTQYMWIQSHILKCSSTTPHPAGWEASEYLHQYSADQLFLAPFYTRVKNDSISQGLCTQYLVNSLSSHYICGWFFTLVMCFVIWWNKESHSLFVCQKHVINLKNFTLIFLHVGSEAVIWQKRVVFLWLQLWNQTHHTWESLS